MRVVVLSRSAPDAIAMAALDALPADRFDLTVALPGRDPAAAATPVVSTVRARSTLALSPALDVNDARRIALLDPDVLVDLAGNAMSMETLLECRPARTLLMVAPPGHASPDAFPDIVMTCPDALRMHLERLHEAVTTGAATEHAAPPVPDAATMMALWEGAVRAHQQGVLDGARAGYERVLDLQPGFAPAHYLLGVLLRDSGEAAMARAQFEAALASAPRFVDARIAVAKAAQSAGDGAAAAALCVAGLPDAQDIAPLWRTLGLAWLSTGDASAAAGAFERALILAPEEADTHFNLGVAHQMRRDPQKAAQAYRRALALHPDMVDAHFNLGVLLQEQGNLGAVAAYGRVIDLDPSRVAAYRNLGETLVQAGRIDAWLANCRRFESACPDSLACAIQALEASQYDADFVKLEQILEGVRGDRFRAVDLPDLVDCLEQLLFLLLYVDVEPEMLDQLAQKYDAAARQFYGEPMQRFAPRRAGRLRIGYLSADFRNHVMGKMMWQALRHHDRERFGLHFYSLSAVRDSWTEQFEQLGHGVARLAHLDERAAAERIASDDLDLLIDLSTHTKGAKEGILALKPARVQLTHVASAGSLGLRTVDFKLTDRYADIPQNQASQLEALLPMEGCVYPYRHIEPAWLHPFHREALGISAETVVIGAFSAPLKLSRRCLGLWQEVLARIPRARLAFSPLHDTFRAVYMRLASAVGIPSDRLLFLPYGRNDAENQARYSIVDFVLDPMPYGGVNGVLEPLDMGVPVVTLLGTRHGERSAFSILANLGVTATVAHSGPEYVAIAARLADDPAFMHSVRSAIRAGLAASPLVDMVAHTRHLEAAYVEAVARKAPEALEAADCARLS